MWRRCGGNVVVAMFRQCGDAVLTKSRQLGEEDDDCVPSHWWQSRRVAVLETLPRRKMFTLQIWKAGPSYPEPESPANSPSCPFPNFGCTWVFSDDTCILFGVASSSPGAAQTLDSVTLSVRMCFAMFFCCDAMTVWLFWVSSMNILCSAFGLHALHFTTGFCTLHMVLHHWNADDVSFY